MDLSPTSVDHLRTAMRSIFDAADTLHTASDASGVFADAGRVAELALQADADTSAAEAALGLLAGNVRRDGGHALADALDGAREHLTVTRSFAIEGGERAAAMIGSPLARLARHEDGTSFDTALATLTMAHDDVTEALRTSGVDVTKTLAESAL